MTAEIEKAQCESATSSEPTNANQKNKLVIWFLGHVGRFQAENQKGVDRKTNEGRSETMKAENEEAQGENAD